MTTFDVVTKLQKAMEIISLYQNVTNLYLECAWRH